MSKQKTKETEWPELESCPVCGAGGRQRTPKGHVFCSDHKCPLFHLGMPLQTWNQFPRGAEPIGLTVERQTADAYRREDMVRMESMLTRVTKHVVGCAQVAWAADDPHNARIYEELLELLGKRDALKVPCPDCGVTPSTPMHKGFKFLYHKCGEDILLPAQQPKYTHDQWLQHCRKRRGEREQESLQRDRELQQNLQLAAQNEDTERLLAGARHVSVGGSEGCPSPDVAVLRVVLAIYDHLTGKC